MSTCYNNLGINNCFERGIEWVEAGAGVGREKISFFYWTITNSFKKKTIDSDYNFQGT